MYDASKPFNDLPRLPPRVELESKAVLKKAIAANTSLAKLEGTARQLPHQGILINSVTLQEARDSSEIENIFTTQDDLYKASASGIAMASAETKEVMRYREALWEGFTSMGERPINISTMVRIARTIKEVNLDVRTGHDTKILNKTTGEVIYTPPAGEHILRDMLRDLESFIHSQDDLDPLIKLAVIHYQFEAIHPFVDGNGRTGRILNLLYLVHAGLLSLPVLYLSRYVIENKDEYYRLLRAVTEDGNWEAWLLYMLEAVDTTAKDTIKLIDNITELMNACGEHVQREAPKIYSKDLIEVIFREPYCKIGWLVENNIAKRQTASTYLGTLVDLGVLESRKIGREKYFINTKLMELLA